MNTLIPRSLILHFSSPSPLSLRPSFLFLHSIAGDEANRRRIEVPPSSSHSFTSSSSPRRHHDEESRSVKVSVWWDFENCSIPGGVNVHRVANRITSALRSSGIKGPITITAFGDVGQMSRTTQEALTATGVCLTHVPHSGRNSSDRSFMADLVYWVSQNPPPAHFFLISGDKDFANILHRLRMTNYNILLASTDFASGVLFSAATIMWPWSELVKGESVTIKHFNHPPDGLYGSWYGYYKGILDDPFEDSQQPAISQPEESMELVTETKPRPIPRTVVNGIRQVLRLYPEGTYLSELRAELKKNNVTMDKDFFGHRKFSNLLSSLPSIVKFIPNPSGEGQPLVVRAHKRGEESVEPSVKPAKEFETSDLDKGFCRSIDMDNGPSDLDKGHTSYSDLGKARTSSNDLDKGCTTTRNGEPPPLAPPTTVVELSPNRKETVVDTSAGTQAATIEEPSLACKESDMDTIVGGVSTPQQGHHDKVEGFLKRIWTALTGPRGDHPNEKNGAFSEVDSEVSVTYDYSKKLKSEGKAAQSKSDSSDPPSSASSSLGMKKLVPKDKISMQSAKHSDAPDFRMSFFSKISSWWKSSKSGANDQDNSSESVKKVINNQEADAHEESVKSLTRISCHLEAHELFSKPHFWDALESFLLTSKGSGLILKSRTREQLVHGLQKEGPWFLKDLKENQLLQLVDLLISEKKWVEEYSSETFPFKLFPAKRRCVPSRAHGSNGLSSLFTSRTSQPNLKRLPEEQNGDQNPVPLRNPYNGSVEAQPPQNLAEFKAWFHKTYNGTEDIEPEEFQELYKSTFNRKLVCSSYGHSSMRSLIAACSTDTGYSQGKKKKPPNREEILSDCHTLLAELLKENPEGFNISKFRPAFIQRYGYLLDYQILGYPKLVSLLQIMPGVRIESSFIVPAGMFKSDSKPVVGETHTDSLQDGRGEVSSLDSERPSNGEDWEELGPVSDTAISDKNTTSQEMDEQPRFSEATLSDEVFSDSEDDTSPQFHGPAEQRKISEEDSSLLQVLDSWYSNKEGGGKDRVQAADGLVDCSRSSPQNPSQKLKSHPQKHYSFVSNSGDDYKEKLVDSILGSLAKTGDSRLQS